MKKVIIFLLLVSSLIFSITFSLKYENTLYSSESEKFLSNTFIPSISYETNTFSFFANILFSNDGKYPLFMKDFYGDYYIRFKNSGVKINYDNMVISFGNLENYDVVETPYSLYFSALGHSRPTLSFKYEDEKFIYETRYVHISYNDEATDTLGKKFVDKGLNFKYYALKVGNFTIGYQESSVYVNRSFDLEYFVNPLPSFFVQYVRENSFYSKGLFNDNSIMGFFATYNDNVKYLYGQILVDDFNANRFFDPDNPTVDKIAWSIGGKCFIDKNLSFKFYHAGATKYTFQPSGNSGNPLYYGYTYYIRTKFDDYVIGYEDNYIGYKYGENNIAFLFGVDYTKNFNIKNEFEMVFSGTKSPVNPWTDQDSYDPGFNLLNEDKIEKLFLLTLNISKNFGIINFGSKIEFGKVFNVLELVENVDDNVGKPYFKPSDNNEFIFNTSIFFKVEYEL